MRDSVRMKSVRDAILDATDDLLTRFGYRKMTIDDLAQTVGIGKGTVAGFVIRVVLEGMVGRGEPSWNGRVPTLPVGVQVHPLHTSKRGLKLPAIAAQRALIDLNQQTQTA